MNFLRHDFRYISYVHGQIRGAETFVFIFTLMVVIFTLLPSLDHILPLLLWMPFDPYVNNFRYVLSYLFDGCCTTVATAVCLSTNMYMYVVLICLNFNYILLRERAERIGFQKSLDERKAPRGKVDVYRDITDLIKLHLKTNR